MSRLSFFSRPLRLFSLILLASLFLPYSSVLAAEFYFGSSHSTLPPQAPLEVGVFLNTQKDTVNAVEGDLVYPASSFVFEQTYDHGSVVNFWMEAPQAPATCTDQCTLHFSGIIPGGFNGERGYLFSLILRPLIEGSAVIDLKNAQALAHDGQGTALTVRVAPLTLSIRSGTSVAPFTPPVDHESPESFVPFLSQDPNVFSGQPFLAFSAQDKGLGIDRYEVREALIGSWGGRDRQAESPYLLEHPWRLGTIDVRAIDRAGNSRSEMLPSRHPVLQIAVVGIIILLVLFFLFLIQRIRSKSSRTHA